MNEGQTQFPYLLVTDSQAVLEAVKRFAITPVDAAKGLATFVSESHLPEINAALVLTKEHYALVEIYDSSYVLSGELSRIFHNLR